MTMVSTGPISLGGTGTSGGLNQSVNVELGRSGTATINMNESAVRTLAGVPSGAISMNNFYGKANAFSFSFAGGTDINLRNSAISAGWNGTSSLTATNTGNIQSSSTGTPALTISGAFPGGVSFINNAIIYGRGGNGGGGGTSSTTPGSPGAGGGTALSVSTPVSITNNSSILGGGGGGGGGGGMITRSTTRGGGGGGGGIGVSSGGSGGSGSDPGGPGSAGTLTTAGGGGVGGLFGVGGPGGPGGGYGSSGTAGSLASTTFPRSGVGSGGGAGPAVVGNGSITWVAFGTRTGPIS